VSVVLYASFRKEKLCIFYF